MMRAHLLQRGKMACQEGEKRKILQEISDNSEEKTPKRSKTTPFGSGEKSRSRQLAAARRKSAECRKNDVNYSITMVRMRTPPQRIFQLLRGPSLHLLAQMDLYLPPQHLDLQLQMGPPL